MPNEFEKQVQQMMDELKLVPSEPVWQKVELQIRKKKDRRRVIFWMIFSALLLGGGIWIGVGQYSNKISYNKKYNNVTDKKNKNTEKNFPLINTTKPIEQENLEPIAKIKNSDKPQNKKTEESKTKNAVVGLNTKPDIQNNISKKIAGKKTSSIQNKKAMSMKVEKTEPEKTVLSEDVIQTANDNDLNQHISNPDTVLHRDSANVISVDAKEIETIPVAVPDSVKQDSASLKIGVQKRDTVTGKKSDEKKYATSKWKLNLVANAGSSNISDVSLFKGLFGSGEKSLAAPNYNGGSVSGGPQLYYGPSAIKKGFSFAIGAVAKKQLAKRTFFSAGLQYNYYSNTIQVGNKINQNRVLMDFSVSQYYSNTGTYLRPYHNRYHFISLPVAMDWQLLKKVPVNFYTGLSMQYLVKTNGLVFDYTTQSYFYSKGAFNRMQLFFEPALTYSISLRKKVLTFGPQLQYGLSRLEKNNSTYHLTSYGLRAQLQFEKK